MGEAICPIESAEFDFKLKTIQLPPVASDMATRRKKQIIAASRYATPREGVELLLRQIEPHQLRSSNANPQIAERGRA